MVWAVYTSKYIAAAIFWLLRSSSMSGGTLYFLPGLQQNSFSDSTLGNLEMTLFTIKTHSSCHKLSPESRGFWPKADLVFMSGPAVNTEVLFIILWMQSYPFVMTWCQTWICCSSNSVLDLCLKCSIMMEVWHKLGIKSKLKFWSGLQSTLRGSWLVWRNDLL